MKKIIHRILPNFILEKNLQIQKQFSNFITLSRAYGQWSSIRDWDCKDSDGNPIPWYTYPAIEYLNHLDLSGLDVFEFGSGNSTLWWAKKAKSVFSVEDDPLWFARVKNKINTDNIFYDIKAEKHLYLANLNKRYDITIIDGKYRPECADHYLNFIDGGFMLIFDNSDWYPEVIDKIRQSLKWVEIDFHGFGPINMYTWTTSIFINPDKINKIKYKKNLSSVGALRNDEE
jgi:hypothetical protein